MIQCSDDQFAQVLNYRTYRLWNRSATYGASQSHKMGREIRYLQHLVGGLLPFSGKDALNDFTWLRK